MSNIEEEPASVVAPRDDEKRKRPELEYDTAQTRENELGRDEAKSKKERQSGKVDFERNLCGICEWRCGYKG